MSFDPRHVGGGSGWVSCGFVLYYTVLYCTALYYTILYYTIPCVPVSVSMPIRFELAWLGWTVGTVGTVGTVSTVVVVVGTAVVVVVAMVAIVIVKVDERKGEERRQVMMMDERRASPRISEPANQRIRWTNRQTDR